MNEAKKDAWAKHRREEKGLVRSKEITDLSAPQVYLFTGKPGTGKTSIIKKAVAGLGGMAGGFYTEEIRAGGGERLGFKVVTLDGQEAILAHLDIRSPYRVSKYSVDVAAFERVGVAALRRATEQSELIVIDEIGKMELLSSDFKQAVIEALNSGKKVLGTIMLAPHPWSDDVKRKPRVKIIEVPRANHDLVLSMLHSWLSQGGGSP